MMSNTPVTHAGTGCAFQQPGIRSCLEALAVSLAVCSCWYYCYYLLAPWIWSLNLHPDPADLTPPVRYWTSQRDGIEIYALYILVFLCGATSFAVSALLSRMNASPARTGLLAICGAAACIYCTRVGFHPPLNSVGDIPAGAMIGQAIAILAVCTAAIALLVRLLHWQPRAAAILAGILLAPVCLIATGPVSWTDYTYVFAPALRILSGASLSDIYFQYDVLPSLLAAAWMKAGLDLDSFQVLGQAAYYCVILGMFVFSTTLFRHAYLPAFMLVALVLVRIYASPYDAVSVFQVTPFRLDLWFPLLILVNRKGPYHWSAGVACGVLLLLLRTFGIIYSLAYLQLLGTLWFFERIDARAPIAGSLTAYLRRCAVPVTAIVTCAVAGHFIFHNAAFGDYAGYYRKIGIGFIRIARDSFYWYVPALIAMMLILIAGIRRRLSPSYVATGIFLMYCVIGNSIYFFGRSHEHNILNISIVLLFFLFFLLDLVTRALEHGDGKDAAPSFCRRAAPPVVAACILALAATAYSHNITGKFLAQAENARTLRMHYPSDVSSHMDTVRSFLGSVAVATDNSPRIYFACSNDFELYYWGGYTPIGYCNPFLSWIFTRDLSRFLQNLLDSGYYLVVGADQQYLLEGLRYTGRTDVQGAAVLTGPAITGARP